MVVTRKKNSSRIGCGRGPNNSNQGNSFEPKGKSNFLEPNIKGNEGRNIKLADSRGVTNPTMDILSALVADNSQRTVYTANVNDMEVNWVRE